MSDKKEKSEVLPDIRVSANAGEIIYRTGPAPKLIEPQTIAVTGDIKTVATFLKQRFIGKSSVGLQQVDPGKAIVYVDKQRLTISLELDPENVYGATVSGGLVKADEIAPFGINEGKIFNRDQFIKLMKFNRIYFANFEEHTTILASLMKLESTVQYNAKDESDDRANKDTAFMRKVETNVPGGFTLDIPIFKGFSTDQIKVDICLGVKGGVLEFWFESVALAELQKTKVDIIFNEQLESAKGLVVIYK